jgi:hypothetical protein
MAAGDDEGKKRKENLKVIGLINRLIIDDEEEKMLLMNNLPSSILFIYLLLLFVNNNYANLTIQFHYSISLHFVFGQAIFCFF